MRRLMTLIPIALVLGTVTTVAVAWGCVFLPWTISPTTVRDRWYGNRTDSTLLLAIFEWDDLGSSGGHYTFGWPGDQAELTPTATPPWLMPWQYHLLEGVEVFGFTATAVGVPCLCFTSANVELLASQSYESLVEGGGGVFSPEQRRYGAIVLRDGSPTAVDQTPELYLPYHPIWPGLLINILFWSALWFLPLNWRGFRAILRRRRGRCPPCGYDLRGDLASGCPECGWGRRST